MPRPSNRRQPRELQVVFLPLYEDGYPIMGDDWKPTSRLAFEAMHSYCDKGGPPPTEEQVNLLIAWYRYFYRAPIWGGSRAHEVERLSTLEGLVALMKQAHGSHT